MKVFDVGTEVLIWGNIPGRIIGIRIQGFGKNKAVDYQIGYWDAGRVLQSTFLDQSFFKVQEDQQHTHIGFKKC